MNFNIAVIPGDGIGPEVIDESIKVLNKIGEKYNHNFLGGTLATTLRKPIYVKSSPSVSLYLKTKGYIVQGDEDNIHSYLTYTDKKIAMILNLILLQLV